jgi:hypothetical protein
MTDCVTVIENPAQTAFLLIAGYDARFECDVAGDEPVQTLWLDRHVDDRLEVLFQELEHLRVPDDPVLDHLGHAGHSFPLRQAAQAGCVCEHETGLVESADRILTQAMVYRGLAADAGIDLGDNRGRHLDPIDSAKVAGGDKAAEIADNTPAQGQQP